MITAPRRHRHARELTRGDVAVQEGDDGRGVVAAAPRQRLGHQALRERSRGSAGHEQTSLGMRTPWGSTLTNQLDPPTRPFAHRPTCAAMPGCFTVSCTSATASSLLSRSHRPSLATITNASRPVRSASSDTSATAVTPCPLRSASPIDLQGGSGASVQRDVHVRIDWEGCSCRPSPRSGVTTCCPRTS